MNRYKKCTKKPFCFLVINTTLTSDSHLCFRKNLLERIQKLIGIVNDKSRVEKLQYDINSIQDGHFWGCSGMGERKSPPYNLSHSSCNNEISYSYTLPKEDSKTIRII